MIIILLHYQIQKFMKNCNMKRETYIKRLVTSYKNLSKEEKEIFRLDTGLTKESSKTENDQIKNWM